MAFWKASVEPEFQEYGGYDEYFLDTAPDRLMCSICAKVLRDPQLMACCGKLFCDSCLHSWFKQQNSDQCPHCRATKKSMHGVLNILDKGVKSEIESHFILCSNYRIGCEWIGELRGLEVHLRECGFVKVPCPNGCKTSLGIEITVFRKDLDDHLLHHCQQQNKPCQYCGHISFPDGCTTHDKECRIYRSSRNRKFCVIY